MILSPLLFKRSLGAERARKGSASEPLASRWERWNEQLAQMRQERDFAREQRGHIRDLAERLMTTLDLRDARVETLQSELRSAQAMVTDLEEENVTLIRQVSLREDRIGLLEEFLKMVHETQDRQSGWGLTPDAEPHPKRVTEHRRRDSRQDLRAGGD